MSRVWARPTWYFFHMFAEKIHPEFYRNNVIPCFNIIRQICYNLPCPDCRYHASNYINTITPRDVSTKDDLKFVLFTFLNDVNRRLGKPIFTWEQLNIYKRARKLQIYNLFVSRFGGGYSSRRDFTQWHRTKVLGNVSNFMKQWWSFFS